MRPKAENTSGMEAFPYFSGYCNQQYLGRQRYSKSIEIHPEYLILGLNVYPKRTTGQIVWRDASLTLVKILKYCEENNAHQLNLYESPSLL